MRFGLRLPSFALGEETARLAEMGAYLRRAEDLGFESAMLIDHLLVAPPAYRTTWLEPVSLLAALAGVTRTIRLGTLVLVLPFRDPVAFAKEWATLDLLSGGRSILGVGVGWKEGEFAAVRIPFRERGAAHERDARGDHRAVGRRPRHLRGPVLPVRGPHARPEAAQRPHPPIWIGGGTQPSEKIYGQPWTRSGRSCAGSRSTRRRGCPILGHGRDGRPGLGRHPRVHGGLRAATRTR